MKKELLWKPKQDEIFWMYNPYHGATGDEFDDDDIDNAYWVNGEMFKTEEEAKVHTRKQRVFNLLMQLSDGINKENNCCDIPLAFEGIIEVHTCGAGVTAYTFSTKEKCQEAIEYIGEKEVYFFLTGEEM